MITFKQLAVSNPSFIISRDFLLLVIISNLAINSAKSLLLYNDISLALNKKE